MTELKKYLCPKCSNEMVIKSNMFHWRGRYFTGCVCEKCNALYDNPEDSFHKYVGLSHKPLEEKKIELSKNEDSDLNNLSFFIQGLDS